MAKPPAETRIGHVHLKVTDLDRAERFYIEALGMERKGRLGDQATFLAYGDYHHHLALNTWHSKDAQTAPVEAPMAGLYHFAVLYPNRKALANAVKRVLDFGWKLDGASDHGANYSIYLRDPDENGIELYYDRPPEDWERDADGNLALKNAPFDVEALLTEAD